MKELGSCEGKISGEHLFSRSIMLLLQGDGAFTISGLPWLAAGETKRISPDALTAKCLCQKHNSALSPLDEAALYFFTALESCLEREAKSAHYIISGHDIERWLLKTVKALAVSRNLAKGRERLSGAFFDDSIILDMIDNPSHWADGTGLYCLMNDGELTENHRHFQGSPIINDDDEM